MEREKLNEQEFNTVMAGGTLSPRDTEDAKPAQPAQEPAVEMAEPAEPAEPAEMAEQARPVETPAEEAPAQKPEE